MPHSESSDTPNSSDTTAERVLDVLAEYFWDSKDSSGFTRAEQWPGRKMFKPHAMHWIGLDEPVRMVLPAFPFKSSNADKVTGILPDFAEYVGLARLNEMCLTVRKVYAPGAQIILATDGVVFNDLLLIDDKTVWAYSRAVQDMISEHLFDHNIRFMHAMELLGLVKGEDLTESVFYDTIDTCRDKILAKFSRPEEAMEELVRDDPDSKLTWQGMKAFVIVDQANSIYRQEAGSKKAFLKDMSNLALKMLARSEGFGALIRERLPQHIRLSIHPSSGLQKLSICLIPQLDDSDIARAPWMASVAVGTEGQFRTVHAKDVRDSHDLVMRNGRPWLFRERSELYDLSQNRESWSLHHTYHGLQVIASSCNKGAVMDGATREKIRQLSRFQAVNVFP